MTPEQFCYWLQGRLELNKEPLSADETQCVRDHLATVFEKVTLSPPRFLPPDLPIAPHSYTYTKDTNCLHPVSSDLVC